MYQPTHPIIVSRVTSELGGVGYFDFLHSNGHYVRFSDGDRFSTAPRDMTPRIRYWCTVNGQRHKGVITDKLLVPRIMEYIGDHRGKKYTNCSALAHFLTTGNFIECTYSDDDCTLLVLTQGMRAYSGQKIGVGDMICIIYAHQRFMRSRRFDYRPAFIKAKKGRHEDGKFTHGLRAKSEVFTPEEVRGLVKNSLSDDYHFLVCVAINNGQPVWISQRGRCSPLEQPTEIVLTVGKADEYPEDVPLLTFLKKRR